LDYTAGFGYKALIMVAKSYPNLKYLNLRKAGLITDESLCVIAKLCNKLEYLNISNCVEITQKSLFEVARSCQNLEELYFAEGDGITDKSISYIINQCSKLRCLDIAYSGVEIEDSSMMIQKRLNIEYLDFATLMVIEVDENTNNFLYHYSKISHAESKHEIANKEVIECYYDLGVAIKKRFDHYRNLNHGERVCLALVNDEIRKQIPDDITNDALKKRKERARKIYDLFFSIGREKIRAVKMFSASIISNLSQDNIDYVIVEILKKRGIVT
ncbi:519_t:CDS:2, partial [Entrophospora sp. SA101]